MPRKVSNWPQVHEFNWGQQAGLRERKGQCEREREKRRRKESVSRQQRHRGNRPSSSLTTTTTLPATTRCSSLSPPFFSSSFQFPFPDLFLLFPLYICLNPHTYYWATRTKSSDPACFRVSLNISFSLEISLNCRRNEFNSTIC